MKKKVKRILKVSASILGIIVLIIIGIMVIRHNPELKGEPKEGKWYRITPEQAIGADESKWHGLIRKGNENKVLVYFYGGGVSINEYTAARPIRFGEEGFYSIGNIGDGLELDGISSKNSANPFKDWTVLVLPYNTGDFHTGTGEYHYTDKEGKDAVLYHNGYINYSSFMNQAMEYVDNTETLVIAGFSAGGFGASLLADDIISNYFPTVDNSTVLVDSSLLLYDNWHEAAATIWQSPEEIAERLTTNNITLDSLKALSVSHPDTKILFDCSTRDGELTKFQNYISNSDYTLSDEMGDVFQNNLKDMVDAILELPNAGVFIWDGLDYYKKDFNLTQHTIISGTHFYKKQFGDKTIAQWVEDAVEGDVKSYGLELLQ